MDSPSFDLQEVKRVLEAALLTSAEPLQLNDLKKLFDEDLSNDVLRNILTELAADWDGRSVELINVASGWRFRAQTITGSIAAGAAISTISAGLSFRPTSSRPCRHAGGSTSSAIARCPDGPSFLRRRASSLTIWRCAR